MTELTIPRYAPVWRTNLGFNGSSDYVEIPNSDDINFGTNQDFTVAFWVLAAWEQKDTKNSDNDVVEKWSGVQGYPYVVRYLNEKAGDNYGKIVAARYDGTVNPSVISKTKINDGQYHHIAFVRKTEDNSGKLYLYVDGKQEATADDNTSADTQNDSPLYLGRRGNNSSNHTNYFTGSIGRLLIFNKALDEKAIQYCMQQKNPILPQDSPAWVEGGLVGDWRCNEGYGTIAFDYAKNNNGTLGGGDGQEARPEWVASTMPISIEFVKGTTQAIGMPDADASKKVGTKIPTELSVFMA